MTLQNAGAAAGRVAVAAACVRARTIHTGSACCCCMRSASRRRRLAAGAKPRWACQALHACSNAPPLNCSMAARGLDGPRSGLGLAA
jgi:hypothetical protein